MTLTTFNTVDQRLMATVVEQSTDPRTVIRELEAAVAREAEARQAFVDGLSPDVKAE